MNLPSDWQIPTENIDMGLAYPEFSRFVSSNGSLSSDWYLRPSSAKVQSWKLLDWAW